MNQKPSKFSSEETLRLLCDKAVESASHAYAPYSNFRVGAAVLGSSGIIYQGANIENASYSLSICAERVAIANARVGGENEITAIAIACVDAKDNYSMEKKMPCGACRQWIKELAPDAHIIIVGEQGSYSISELLPYPFNLKPLG